MKASGVNVRAVLGVAVLAGGILGGWGHTSEARAAVASRGDPIFWLAGTSGGAAADYGIQIGVAVSTSRDNILGITYALHGPVGTTVTLEYATPDTLAALESYTYTADRADKQVVAVTTITTTGGSVPVTVNESAIQVGTHIGLTVPFEVSGMSNQSITTVIGDPNLNIGVQI